MAFHKDIALTPVKDGLFQTEIIEDYWIIVGPNGGYLGALLTSAGDIHVGKDSHQLRGLTIHYLSPPKLGTTQVSVETIRSGKSVDFVRFEMIQDSVIVLVATGSWAKTSNGLELPQITMPEVPNPMECPTPVRLTETPTRLHEKWEIRSVDQAISRPASLSPSHVKSDLTWWIRPKEATPLSSGLLVAAADALPPPIMVHFDQIQMAPTIDLSVHIRAEIKSVNWTPDSWMLVRFVTNHASGGFIEEDGLVWNEEGILLCMSRQLALAR